MKKFLPVFLCLALAIPLVVNAADALATVCSILITIRNIIAAIGFAIAVILLIVSAIRYMTAGGDETKQTSARKGIINAIIGIAILIAAMFIITLVASILISGAGPNWNPFGDPCGQVILR